MSQGRITVIYDNRTCREGVSPGWGFSALLEYNGVNLLFDTGGDKIILESNSRALGIDIKKTDYLFFSHEHCDHVGAASSALHQGLKVVHPISFPQALKDKFQTAGAEPIEVSGPVEFSPDLLSTGELGTIIKEQSLIIKTRKGSVLITGCAHPGIVSIARSATDIAGGPLSLVLGGFHLGGASAKQVNQIASSLQDLGVGKVGPCHCTGDLAIGILQKAFGEHGLEVMAGTKIDLDQIK